jgi:uncharacterized membrane-anchored protein YhcB (DUF1043 family)
MPQYSKAPAARRTSLNTIVEQSTLMLMSVIVVLIIGLAVLRLFHQNSTATRGYTLRTLEAERAELSYQEEVLTTQLAEVRSLDVLLENENVQAMNSTLSPVYVKDNTAVALNQN